MTIPTESTRCAVCGAHDDEVVARGRDWIFHGSEDELTAVRCGDCGHVYLNPRPTPDAIGLMYPDSYPSFSGAFEAEKSVLGRIKDRILLSRFNRAGGRLPAGARVLDVGCGDGQFLQSIARARPDLRLHGLDWKFGEANRRALEQQGMTLFEARLEDADLPDDYFDLILMNQLIEHLWEPEAAMRNLLGTLRRGGSVSIETPNTDGWDRRWFIDGLWGGYYFPRHLNLFSTEGLAALLKHAGFEIAAQRDLVAPMIWCYSFRAWAQTRHPVRPWLDRLFAPENPAALAAFTALDLGAMTVGRRTSNQKVDARRPTS